MRDPFEHSQDNSTCAFPSDMKPDWNFVLVAVKFASLFAGSIFGFFGTIFETHKKGDNNRRLNTWGYVAVIGIGVSLVLGAAAQGIEVHLDIEKRQSDSVATAKVDSMRRLELTRQEAMTDSLGRLMVGSRDLLRELEENKTLTLNNLKNTELALVSGNLQAKALAASASTSTSILYHASRAQAPLWPVHADWTLYFPLSSAPFAEYSRRVPKASPGMDWYVGSKSDVFPRAETASERDAYALTTGPVLSLRIWRIERVVDQPESVPLSDSRIEPDLRMAARDSSIELFNKNRYLNWTEGYRDPISVGDSTVKRFLPALYLGADASTGAITSSLDLIGSVVQLWCSRCPKGTKLNSFHVRFGGNESPPAVEISLQDPGVKIWDNDPRTFQGLVIQKRLTAKDLRLDSRPQQLIRYVETDALARLDSLKSLQLLDLRRSDADVVGRELDRRITLAHSRAQPRSLANWAILLSVEQALFSGSANSSFSMLRASSLLREIANRANATQKAQLTDRANQLAALEIRITEGGAPEFPDSIPFATLRMIRSDSMLYHFAAPRK